MTPVDICASSGTWLGRSMSYLNDSYDGLESSAADGGAPEKICLLFGLIRVSPLTEEVLSLVIPLLVGVLLGSMWHGGVSGGKHRSLHATSKRFGHLFSALKFLMTHDTSKQIKVHKDTVMEPNYKETERESGVDPAKLPKHIAVIMDGNRRYGRRHYGKGSLGHLEGGKKSIEFIEWCHTEGVLCMTLYAFSSENWNRSKSEVDALMALFERYLREDLRPILFNRKIKFNHLYTDKSKIPPRLAEAIDQIESDTKDFGPCVLNVCMSYGSRPEIVTATKQIAQLCCEGKLSPSDITEDIFSNNLTTAGLPEPEILLRTSGEYRISNFLLWQCAYSEFFFAECDWPELEKEFLLDVLRQYANGRNRRFGL